MKMNKLAGDRRCWRDPAIVLGCVLAITCSGLAQSVRTAGPSTTKSSGSTKAGTTLLYVALYNAKAINVYDAFGQGQPIGQLVDGLAHGNNSSGVLTVDQTQKVYVATDDMVLTYASGNPVPWQRYDFLDQPYPAVPKGLAVGPDGTLYAALLGQHLVVAYAKGKTKKASLVIPVPSNMPSGSAPYAVAVDTQNNLYIQYGGTYLPGSIQKCVPNSGQCTDLGITLGAAGLDLLADSKGNLIACDMQAAQIDVFAPGSTQPRVISQGLQSCPTFALNQAEDTLFVANQSPTDGQSVVSVFDYASGNLLNTISGGIPSGELIVGVAVSPSAQ